jgi:hypothetical protein
MVGLVSAIGIGGLGCFSCGAKGKENFVMDRDRIVEDVADLDDYFDYERPLDFVSRAERRKVLKEAKGDEELANKLLVEKANRAAGITPETLAAEANSEVVDAEIEAPTEEDVGSEGDANNEEENPVEVGSVEEDEADNADDQPTAKVEPPKKPPTPKEPAKKAPEPKPASDDDFDILGLD